jgi:hypothetical protein
MHISVGMSSTMTSAFSLCWLQLLLGSRSPLVGAGMRVKNCSQSETAVDLPSFNLCSVLHAFMPYNQGCGSAFVSMRIRIRIQIYTLLRIRIRFHGAKATRIHADPDPDQTLESRILYFVSDIS